MPDGDALSFGGIRRVWVEVDPAYTPGPFPPASGDYFVRLELGVVRDEQARWLDCSFLIDSSDTVLDRPIYTVSTPASLTQLGAVLNQNKLYYSQQIWLREDPQARIMQLAPFQFTLGDTVVNLVDHLPPQPLRSSGTTSCTGSRTRRTRWTSWTSQNVDRSRVSVDTVAVPTGGVFGEAVLGRANSAEKLDITRFFDWQDSPPPAPPQVQALMAGTHTPAQAPDLPTFDKPLVSIQSPVALLFFSSGDALERAGGGHDERRVPEHERRERQRRRGEPGPRRLWQGGDRVPERLGAGARDHAERLRGRSLREAGGGEVDVGRRSGGQQEGGRGEEGRRGWSGGRRRGGDGRVRQGRDAGGAGGGDGAPDGASGTSTNGLVGGLAAVGAAAAAATGSNGTSGNGGGGNGSGGGNGGGAGGRHTATAALIRKALADQGIVTAAPPAPTSNGLPPSGASDPAFLHSSLVTDPAFSRVDQFVQMLQLLDDADIVAVIAKRLGNLDPAVDPLAKYAELIQEITDHNAALYNPARFLYAAQFVKNGVLPNDAGYVQADVAGVRAAALDVAVGRALTVAQTINGGLRAGGARADPRRVRHEGRRRPRRGELRAGDRPPRVRHGPASHGARQRHLDGHGLHPRRVLLRLRPQSEGRLQHTAGERPGRRLKAAGKISTAADVAAWNANTYPHAQSAAVKLAARSCDFLTFIARGYVQFRGRKTYAAISKLASLGNIDFVATPDRAADPATAAAILVVGMRDGLFTGKKLADYAVAAGFDAVNARQIVNHDPDTHGAIVRDVAKKYKKALVLLTKLDQSAPLI